MSDIFISYKREEQPAARKLADALQKKGWSVWWDPKLRAGEHFDDTIERSLNDAKCVIVMWSKLSVNSRYVKDEATYALNRNKLVPIIIEEVDLPFRFEGIQAGQLIDWDGLDSFPGYQKLVADVVSILGPPPGEVGDAVQKEAAKYKKEKELKRKDSEVEGKHKETKAKIANERSTITNEKPPRQKRLILGIVAIAVIIVLSIIGWLLFLKPKYAKTFKNSIDMEFVLISAGSYTMGSSPGIGKANEGPSHTVKISRPFYLQKTEVTQGQWREVMWDNPSRFKECGDDCPVESVSWEDANKFIKKLNEMEGSETYRLPTEAEWEYAVRAETTTLFSFGDDEDKLTGYAWYKKNSEEGTHRAAIKKPNPWGLHDMHGNVYELVEDDWHDTYDGAPKDGRAWIDVPRGADRVIRGGDWNNIARACRSAHRDDISLANYGDDIGFRIAGSVGPLLWVLDLFYHWLGFRPEAQ